MTPNAPMQRGGIWRQGGSSITRNLLDFFDITIDQQGRVLVGYVNGCAGGNCAQAAPTATGNAYTATATIARQSSGRRLIAQYDPSSSLSAPGRPFVAARRVGKVVYLGWNEADTGNSPIEEYKIMRGTVSSGETLLTTVPGTHTSYTDLTATDTRHTYYYQVLAVNSVGTSCGNNEVAAPYVGDTCNGMLIHRNEPGHPEATGGSAGTLPIPQYLIDYIVVAEPFQNGADNLMFRMKVGNLQTVPPNSRWRIVWDSFASPGQQFYVGMTSDDSGKPTFEYGTIATAVVGLVLGVPEETKLGSALAESRFTPNGMITIYVPKSAVGDPKPGDLLGAVNGRTFADNSSFERSTQLIDHTFVKGQTDNSYPAATYMLVGNNRCAVR